MGINYVDQLQIQGSQYRAGPHTCIISLLELMLPSYIILLWVYPALLLGQVHKFTAEDVSLLVATAQLRLLLQGLGDVRHSWMWLIFFSKLFDFHLLLCYLLYFLLFTTSKYADIFIPPAPSVLYSQGVDLAQDPGRNTWSSAQGTSQLKSLGHIYHNSQFWWKMPVEKEYRGLWEAHSICGSYRGT